MLKMTKSLLTLLFIALIMTGYSHRVSGAETNQKPDNQAAQKGWREKVQDSFTPRKTQIVQYW